MGILDAPVRASSIVDASQSSKAALIGDSASARIAFGAAEQRVQITDCCYSACPTGSGNDINSVGTYKFFYTVGVDATNLQLGFGKWSNTTISGTKLDIDSATTITFSAAVEDATGAVWQLTFNGQKSFTLAGGLILSDRLPIQVAKGDVIYVRVFLSAGSAHLNRYALGGGLLTSGGGFTATTDLTPTGSGAVTSTSKVGWGPMCIIGTPIGSDVIPKAVIFQGDSIAVGAYDGWQTGWQFRGGFWPSQPAWMGGGYLMRSLSGRAGVINGGLEGESLYTFLLNAGHFRRASLTQFAKYAIIEYGVGDFSSSRTAAQLQADLLTLATRNHFMGIAATIIQTITPQSTSTDRWTTTANQTTVSPQNAERVSHNNWVRDGGPIDPTTKLRVNTGTVNALRFGNTGHPIKGYIEVADAVESARDSGKWKTPNRIVTDGAITSASANLTSATAGFTSADVGSTVIVAGAGTASADLVATITTIGSSTAVALTLAAGTTVSGATTIIGAKTQDGVHPSSNGHTDITALVQTPLLALVA
jgi:hypothetical protein